MIVSCGENVYRLAEVESVLTSSLA